MTKLRVPNGVKFRCNHPGCKAEYLSQSRNVQSAWRAAAEQGWRIAQIGATYQHYCSWLHRPQPQRAAG